MQLSDDLVKGVFDNVRNFALSATVIGAGVLIAKHAPTSERAVYQSVIAALCIICGLGLFALNAAHGWHKLTALQFSKLGLGALQVIYALVAIEMVAALWEARGAL